MPDDTRAVAAVDNRALMEMPLDQAIEAYAPNFAAVLPPQVSVAHFKRMVVLAISTNPDLWSADRRTLFNAAVKCASDGLLPDGREAALVVFRTKIKDKQGREHWIDAVQYMPMIAGIRKRMRNSGDVVSATAEIVCRNDQFHYRLGEDASIHHEPPPLDQDRGNPIGAYAIIRLASGEIIREVMRYSEIERARAISRAKDGPAWKNWWSEMARKTVLRRASKAVPQTAILERLLARDDEIPALPPPESLPLVPPRPVLADFDGATDSVPPPPREHGAIDATIGEAIRPPALPIDAPAPPIDDLPPHVTEPEASEEGATAADEPEERDAFWSQDKFFVARVMTKGKADWSRTQQELLYWIADARSADEVEKLIGDSRLAVDGLRLADKALAQVVLDAAAARTAELAEALHEARRPRCPAAEAAE